MANQILGNKEFSLDPENQSMRGCIQFYHENIHQNGLLLRLFRHVLLQDFEEARQGESVRHDQVSGFRSDSLGAVSRLRPPAGGTTGPAASTTGGWVSGAASPVAAGAGLPAAPQSTPTRSGSPSAALGTGAELAAPSPLAGAADSCRGRPISGAMHLYAYQQGLVPPLLD